MIAEAGALPAFDDPASARCSTVSADRRVVLLGEASMGRRILSARAAITRRLVERHGFSIVAVEADWPDAASIDRYVDICFARKCAAVLSAIPTWMWRTPMWRIFRMAATA